MDRIWYQDPMGFVQIDKLQEFVPSSYMTFAQKLNAMMRFAIYFTILLLVTQNNAKVIYIAVFVAIFTLALYHFYEREKDEFKEKHKAFNLHYDKVKKEACVMPTKNNPFANILVSDYALNPSRKPGCNITKPAVKKKAEEMFGHNLYSDVDDIWSRNTSSRNFYQTPIQSIPNKQNEFAKWLYGHGKTCKEGNGKSCIRNQM